MRPLDDEQVGHKKPPQHTRWKKGQCGNPKGLRKRVPKSTAQLIDSCFSKLITVTINGEPRRITGFEAILRQVWIKEMAGSKRALVVRLKYQGYAAGRDPGDQEVFIVAANTQCT